MEVGVPRSTGSQVPGLIFCLAVTRLQGKQRRNRPCKDDELVVMKWFQCIFLQNNMLLAKPSWYQINQMHLLTPCRQFRLSEKWV